MHMKRIVLILLLSGLFPSLTLKAYDSSTPVFRKFMTSLEARCRAYGWNDLHPRAVAWEYYRKSKGKRPLFFTVLGNPDTECTLFLGGVHGDELPTVYLLLKLADRLNEQPEAYADKCIVIAPLVNPDGFFAVPSQRVNANGVDVNRNFPTRDWQARAHALWRSKGKQSKRYYPGATAGSEAETLFQMALLKRFRPSKIFSVHSPLGFYDFDGSPLALDTLGQWLENVGRETDFPVKKFGYFPGSLGNYGGYERNIFTLTLELPTSDPAKASEYYAKFYPAFAKLTTLVVPVKNADS